MQSEPLVSPWKSFVWLLLFALVGAVVGSLFGILAAFIMEGQDALNSVLNMTNGSVSNLNTIRVIQGFSSLGMFLLPPVLLGYFENNKGVYFPQKNGIDFRFIILTFIGTISFQPLIQLSAIINESMILPDSLKGLEVWMREQEDSTAQVVKALLAVKSWEGLVGNLLVIAIIAAIGEEALFRGGMQHIFLRFFKNYHVAIWVVAIIFSAIHIQFYGFLPRMLMGAFFGYLFYWTGNIWYPILAHFINNAGAVFQGFFISRSGGSMEELDDFIEIPIYGYIAVVVVFTWIIMQFLKVYHQQKHVNYGKELD